MVSENRSIPCRVLVCFLALLVFFWAVIPPLNVSATEVVATAAVVGIDPVAAIAGILLCLGVAYVGSGGFDDLVDTLTAALPSDFMVTVGNNLYVEGLTYEDTVYVSESVIKWAQGVLFDADNPVIQKVASGFQRDSLYQSSVRKFRTIYDYYNETMIANTNEIFSGCIVCIVSQCAPVGALNRRHQNFTMRKFRKIPYATDS